MKRMLFVLAMCGTAILHAQKQDYVWLLGYGGGGQSGLNDSFGLSILRFDSMNHLSIENNQTCPLDFWGGNSAMSDSAGMLLFFSNAEKIYNANYALMSNGNNINGTDQRQPQGVISLPLPQHPDQYMVITLKDTVFSPQLVSGIRMYKNTVKVDINDPDESEVLEKKTTILEDTIEYGQITAVKHGNGRDWWILMPESHSNRYYSILLGPDGVSHIDTQALGDVFYAGLGQAVFSPDGRKYVRANGIKTTTPTELYIYDFDRCTGKLSNPIHLEYENWGLGVGCAISPNARYLYAINANYIFQYDLEAVDVAASKTLVAAWDGYVHEIHFYTTFALAQLAPDGRIYISTAFSTPFLHVIEYPDRKGLACQVRQRAIHLPNYNNYSIPNLPNFRLGPLDGSAGDTLGIDNHPLCNWRWEQEDTLSPLKISFTDLSSYEASEWFWDFGDGSMSQDTNPVHVFPSEGIYQVCLEVSNPFGVDTFCQVLQLSVSAAHDPILQNQAMVSPNPFQEHLSVSNLPPDAEMFRLYDQTGNISCVKRLVFDRTEIDTSALPPGLYFWDVVGNKHSAKAGKIVKTGQ